jgi:hypothetical protein
MMKMTALQAIKLLRGRIWYTVRHTITARSLVCGFESCPDTHGQRRKVAEHPANVVGRPTLHIKGLAILSRRNILSALPYLLRSGY